jgi:hypothetical protein
MLALKLLRHCRFDLTPGQPICQHPDGHPKLLHLWPPKLPQAGRLNYQLFGLFGSDFLSW